MLEPLIDLQFIINVSRLGTISSFDFRAQIPETAGGYYLVDLPWRTAC